MSSHHFVKEKQEPALLILADASINQELVAELLEWAPIVFVEDRCLPMINHNPIKIDYVIQCTMTSEEVESWTAFQEQVNIIRVQLETKLNDVVEFLKSDKHDALSIVGHKSEMEHLTLDREDQLNIIFYSNTYKSYRKANHFKKWKEKDSKFEFYADVLQTKNLIQEDHTFRVIEDGNIELNASSEIIIKEYFIER